MSKTLAVMPTYMRTVEDYAITCRAIETLLATSNVNLLVVDDGSPDRGAVERLRSMAWRLHDRVDMTVKSENEGFSKSVNYGLRLARKTRRDALLVNADMEFVDNGWLTRMQASRGDVVGGLLTYPNGTVQHAGVYFSVIGRHFDHIYRLAPRTLDLLRRPRICPVTGALQLIRYETITRVGIYDENFRLGYEDVDYCLQTFRAGLTCMYEPAAEAIHYEGLFRERDVSDKHREWRNQSWMYLNEKHQGYDFSDYVPSMIWPDEL